MHAQKSYSVKCSSGGGSANFRYKEGNVNTRIYFHNNCTHPVNVSVHTVDLENTHKYCIATGAGQKGSKEIQQGASGSITKLTRGC
ncbi:hypothetical protein [Streptomyces sp. ODS28]|uniref:hypothetical protein n=1 Tax=Streptomyces sp. ODS28 TaxID=3136688 RepID=UPI0031ECC1D9